MPINITELIGTEEKEDCSSDSDQELDNPSRDINKKPAIKKSRVKKSVDKLENILKKINSKLEKGEAIDLSDYPPLFIVNFRGTHFFTTMTDQSARREVRKQIKAGDFKHSIYSAALYDLAGLKLGEKIDTFPKKRKIIAAKKKLAEDMLKLESSPAEEKNWYGNQKVAANLFLQHYQRYVNNYKEFRAESIKKEHDCYKVLSSPKTPYVSTADEAKHAILYALGGKTELAQGALRPAYLADGQAQHPKIGYVQIIFHTLQDIARLDPVFLSVLHGTNQIDIKGRLLNEREITYKGCITAKHIVATRILRFPSFNVDFNSGYHSGKYGITSNASFSSYKKVITNQTAKTTTLLDRLANHYEQKLMVEAQEIAAQRGSFIVYLGLDGRLRKNLAPTAEISDLRKKTKANLSLVSMFKQNLTEYNSEKNEETDSDEEFPSLRKIKK